MTKTKRAEKIKLADIQAVKLTDEQLERIEEMSDNFPTEHSKLVTYSQRISRSSHNTQ